ncbi:MAG: hypothetical protein IKW59_03690 [Clostridia bacterium]|nr:hypothetical protein [Clostridia bacterium]
MLKKTISIFLSIVLILSLCSATVFGAMPESALTCTTAGTIDAESTGMAVDNFDDEAITEAQFKRYNRYGDQSDIFVDNEISYSTFRILSANNASDANDKVLEVSNKSAKSTSYLKTLDFYVAEDYVTELVYDMRFTSIPTGTALYDTTNKVNMFGRNKTGANRGAVRFQYDSSLSAWTLSGDDNNVQVKTNKLYKVCMIVVGTKLYTYILDADSDTVLTYSETQTSDLFEANSVQNIQALQLTKMGDSEVTLELDNAKLVRYNRTVTGPAILSSTIANGAAGIDPAITYSAEIVFDQKVTTAAATLKSAGAEDIACTVTPVANKLNTYTVSWEDTLAIGTTYTLDMSATSNGKITGGDDAKITFTTTESGVGKLTEDFESGTVNKSQFKGNILQLQYSSRDGEASFADGYNGNALKIEVAAEDRGLALDPLVTKETYTPEVISAEGAEAAEYEKFIVTYRFNLKDMADVGTATVADTDDKGGAAATTSGSRIHMAIDDSKSLSHQSLMARISTENNKPFIQNPSNANYGAEFELDHWYNIVWLVDGTDQTFKFIDAESGKLVWERSFTSETYTAGASLYVIPYSGRRLSTGNADSGYYVYNEGQTVLIDDFTIWRVNPYKNKQKLELTASNDGAVLDVDSAANNKITLTYNQPILGASTDFEVYKGTTKEELAYSTANIKFADFCTQEITFSNLDYSSDYILDYSAMKAASGAEILAANKPSSFVEFSTAAAPQTMSIVGDISCTGQATGDTISFDLYSKETQNTTVVTAFYNRVGNLLGIQSQVENMTADETKDVAVMLAQPQNADYIKIFVWNDLEKCQPLSKKYNLHAPVDSLDVLLIGSSLSEDAGRYLDKVAAADNFDLNVRVTGIGGSNFTHHAANLRAELAGRTVEEARAINKDHGNKLLYWTYLDGKIASNLGSHLLIDALQAQEYDVISLQQAAYHNPDVQEDITYIAETIRKFQPNAEIIFYQTWSPYNSTKSQRSFYFTNTITGQVNTWAAATGAQAENVMQDGSVMKIFPAGKAFYLADNKYEWCGEKYLDGVDGDTESEAKDTIADKMNVSPGLWRDYNHASYYGCYLADAVWYEMLTGRKAKVGTADAPAVPMPENIGIDMTEHLKRLEQLSDIAHQAVLEQK